MGKVDLYLAMVLHEKGVGYCKSCGKEINRNDVIYNNVKDADRNKRSEVKIVCSECMFPVLEILSWSPSVTTLSQAVHIIEEEYGTYTDSNGK